MEQFWDAKAREDAFWFVDSRLRYHDADQQAFWAGGEDALGALLGALDVRLPPSSVIVDIGCGLGRLTRPLARDAARVIALDVSKEMLTQARELNRDLQNVDWVHGDGESLRPVSDGERRRLHLARRVSPHPQSGDHARIYPGDGQGLEAGWIRCL